MSFVRAPLYDGRRAIGELACRARSNGIFAISEICKGLAIVIIGDMVIADEVGELVCVVALTCSALSSTRYLHQIGRSITSCGSGATAAPVR